jgi:hypothetical protein
MDLPSLNPVRLHGCSTHNGALRSCIWLDFTKSEPSRGCGDNLPTRGNSCNQLAI